MVLFTQVPIQILDVLEVGSLGRAQIPPGVILLQDAEREHILVRRVEDVGADAFARCGHGDVDVDLQFGVHRCVRLELEHQITVHVPGYLFVQQEHDQKST